MFSDSISDDAGWGKKLINLKFKSGSLFFSPFTKFSELPSSVCTNTSLRLNPSIPSFVIPPVSSSFVLTSVNILS